MVFSNMVCVQGSKSSIFDTQNFEIISQAPTSFGAQAGPAGFPLGPLSSLYGHSPAMQVMFAVLSIGRVIS